MCSPFEQESPPLLDLESLHLLGFSQYFSSQFAALDEPERLAPARVVADQRGHYTLLGERLWQGTLSGRLRHELTDEQRPVTGDWVAVEPVDDARAVVSATLERSTVLRRKAAGTTAAAQILAANVDVFFVVTTATDELNPRRVERFLAAIWSGGAQPVIVLNKVDLVESAAPMIDALRAVARDEAPVVAVSALDGRGLDALAPWVEPTRTVGFVGSSGVGKSSLINAMLHGHVQRASHVADDGRGRHTTTGRSLHRLENGAWLMDTPGLREFGAVDDEGDGLRRVFSDIDALASQCRFRDCRHDNEPGCAVRAAIAAGSLAEERLRSLHKLEREARAAAVRHDHAAAAAEKRKWKGISRSLRSLARDKDRD
jgi:ribosome biogenesis GTPase / thiamine phosphate phosphatase